MIVVGIDPGSRYTGLCVLDGPPWTLIESTVHDGGPIVQKEIRRRARVASQLAARDRGLASWLAARLREYPTAGAICVEEQSLPPGARAGNRMGHAHGVIQAVCELVAPNALLLELSPREARQIVTGLRAPTEAAAHEAAGRSLAGSSNLIPSAKRLRPHALDAIVVALACCSQREILSMAEVSR